MDVNAYDLAQRFIGLKEVPGTGNNPQILAMLKLDASWPSSDEVPWCSAFVNYICWLLRLPRSKDLRARSWLGVGVPIPLDEAAPGYDLVVFNRGGPPDASVLDAPGHVAFFAGIDPQSGHILCLGGNQSNSVSVSRYEPGELLGVRRLSTYGWSKGLGW
jgi:uncharacterized protein (TIGR02594 family)